MRRLWGPHHSGYGPQKKKSFFFFFFFLTKKNVAKEDINTDNLTDKELKKSNL